MLICRSVVDGKVLGMARDLEIATQMSQANDWRNWYVVDDGHEDARFPAVRLAVVEPEPTCDPRNTYGKHA